MICRILFYSIHVEETEIFEEAEEYLELIKDLIE